MNTICEIHKSMLPENHDSKFFLVADNSLLNYEPRIAHNKAVLDQFKTDIIWSGTALPINIK